MAREILFASHPPLPPKKSHMWDALPAELRAAIFRERKVQMAREVLREEENKLSHHIDVHRLHWAWRAVDHDPCFRSLVAGAMRAHSVWLWYYE